MLLTFDCAPRPLPTADGALPLPPEEDHQGGKELENRGRWFRHEHQGPGIPFANSGGTDELLSWSSDLEVGGGRGIEHALEARNVSGEK